MPATVAIRPATPDDRPAILAVVRAAFAHGDQHGQEEVDIVERTWSLGAAPAGLELVAVDGGTVVGHVLGADGDLAGRRVLGLAPLAVVPGRQGEGIGSSLVGELVERADRAGYPLVALLGSPAYYGRFGFEPAGPLGIHYEPVGPDNPHFQVRRLRAFDPTLRGAFAYCWELGDRF